MKTSEIIVFIIYLAFMLSIGVFFFFKDKNGGEKTYFLGGRQMGAWVAAVWKNLLRLALMCSQSSS